MKRFINQPHLALIVAGIILLSIAGWSIEAVAPQLQDKQQWNAVQQELWKLEEQYWGYVKDLNTDGMLAMMHQEFTGWSPQDAVPSSKAQLKAKFANAPAQNRPPLSYHLQPHAVTLHGNIAQVYCSGEIKVKTPEGERTASSFKALHVWMKQGNEWKIIGGMGSTK